MVKINNECIDVQNKKKEAEESTSITKQKTIESIRFWKGLIHEMDNRPRDMSKKKWLAQRGLTERQYYYWKTQIDVHENANKIAPQQLNVTNVSSVMTDKNELSMPSIIIEKENFRMEISITASDKMVELCLKYL